MKLQRSLPSSSRPVAGAVPPPRLSMSRSCVSRACAAAPPRPSLRSSSPRITCIRVPASRFSVRVRAEASAAPVPPSEEEDYDLLSTKIADLVSEVDEELRGCSIYLVGMMGCGKSTLGKMLANTLKYNFFDSDTMVELAHDKKSVASIFTEYGQDYFRDCEGQVLKQLSPYKNLVVATGGGAVLRPMNWSYMQQGIVVWLKGSPELHAKRVSKDGLEKRPLLADAGTSGDNLYEAALSKVTTMLSERTKFYENADIVVELDGRTEKDLEFGAPTVVVMYRLLTGLKAKIIATREEREAKRNFRIENADQVNSMRTIPSPVMDAQAQE